MADLALDISTATQGLPQHHDLVLSASGDLQLTQGQAAVEQAIAQALKQFTQDWFLNMAAGLNYRGELFGGRDLSSAFEAVMQNRVLSVPGVLGLNTWNATVNRTTRSLQVQFEARLTTGTVLWSSNLDLS